MICAFYRLFYWVKIRILWYLEDKTICPPKKAIDGLNLVNRENSFGKMVKHLYKLIYFGFGPKQRVHYFDLNWQNAIFEDDNRIWIEKILIMINSECFMYG